jgi:hypothetical protein
MELRERSKEVYSMKKILIIGLSVLLAVFLGSVAIGGGQASAASYGPVISPENGTAYDGTFASGNAFAMDQEVLTGPSISWESSIPFDKTIASCVPYALNSDNFSGPVVSSEHYGAVGGTEDEISLLAMLCR